MTGGLPRISWSCMIFTSTGRIRPTPPSRRLRVHRWPPPLSSGLPVMCPSLIHAQLLDVIGDRLMYRLQYRNFGGYAAMVVNHTVNSGGTAAIRWYELRNAGSGWTIHQQGTYSGDTPDGNHRWMGSMAMDHQGNMALGYSVTNGTGIYPSISYTGRLAGDGNGTLPQGETILLAGGGSQTGTHRWGDYSMMSVDPVDDCTFWYTQEYYPVTSGWDWHTRIASFKFPGCTTGPAGELSGTVRDEGGIPLAGVTVTADDGAGIVLTTDSRDDGTYRFAALPVGTYTVTASKFGYLDNVAAAVQIIDTATTTLDFSLQNAPIFTLAGQVTDAGTGLPLYARINYTYGAVWTDPADGTYSVDLPQHAYVLDVTGFVAGYDPAVRSITLDADRTEDFALAHDAACQAPGYAWAYPERHWASGFDSCTLPAGWTVNNLAAIVSGRFDDPGRSPTGNLTGGSGCFADADSDFCGNGSTMDTELVSPSFDCSAMAGRALSNSSMMSIPISAPIPSM